jgi:hypothetical protein
MQPQILLYLLAVLLISTGCAPTAITDPDQLRAEELPVGSSFFLNEDVIIRSGLLSIGIPSLQIQDGRIVGRLSVQQFEPYCEFILNTRAKGETVVGADNFVVESVSNARSFMRRESNPTVIAAAPGFRLADSDPGAGGFTVTVIDYLLSSDFQGSNYILRCRMVADSTSPRSYTVGDLRNTLGNVFSIQIVVNQSLDVQ